MHKRKFFCIIKDRVAFIYLFEKFVLLQKDIRIKYLYEQYFKERAIKNTISSISIIINLLSMF